MLVRRRDEQREGEFCLEREKTDLWLVVLRCIRRRDLST